MCGIAGIYALTPSGAFDEALLMRMVESIRHRGPDEQSCVQRGAVGLGISRLAIIDPEGSHQPITNENKDLYMVFNGEIYNYKQLRRILEQEGHRFDTEGDGEVIVHGYEQWGTGIFEKLRGMFAIALWDERNGHLLLARDRMGIKPLYTYRNGDRFVFASEVKAIFASGSVAPGLHSEMLECYLAFRYVPAPETLFAGIHKLSPGEFLKIENGRETKQSFYSLSFTPKLEINESDARVQLYDYLVRSVQYRLQSDRPLGLFLSGGLDSGFLVALARKLSGHRLDTFSVGFNRSGIYDETPAAEFMAQKFDTCQHSLLMDHREFMQRLPDSVFFMDEPMADPSSVPMQALSHLASRHVKVILSGEGGDELFAGYPRYLGEAIAGRYWVPSGLTRWIARLLRRRISKSKRRGIEGIGIREAARRHLFWQAVIPDGIRRNLLPRTGSEGYGRANETAALAVLERITNEVDTEDDFDRLFYFDLKSWLVEDLLLKKDKMGMSASIEARVPYLDQDVVEFAMKLPLSFKVRGLKGKYIFRRLLEDHLPKEVLVRPKIGFAVPLDEWFREELREAVQGILTENGGFINEWLDGGRVKEVFTAHNRGEDLSLVIYSLLVLELWGRIFLRGESPQELSDRISFQLT